MSITAPGSPVIGSSTTKRNRINGKPSSSTPGAADVGVPTKIRVPDCTAAHGGGGDKQLHASAESAPARRKTANPMTTAAGRVGTFSVVTFDLLFKLVVTPPPDELGDVSARLSVAYPLQIISAASIATAWTASISKLSHVTPYAGRAVRTAIW